MEVLCTLTIDVEHIHYEIPNRISFRAGGMMHHLTMVEFSIALRVYLPHEIEDSTYENLVYATRAFDYSSLWRQYNANARPYDPSRSKMPMLYSIPMWYF